MDIFDVVIVGAGPAGLSAAARAAKRGLSHLLIERGEHLADTIYKYQKKKLVMATPDRLPLQSDLRFELASREDILGWWDEGVASAGVDILRGVEVTGVEGEKGAFMVMLAGREPLQARHVVLAIGLQGNLRTFDPAKVPGADLVNSATGAPQVGYQLDDPAAFFDKDVVVVGAGDAAIENAVALAESQNRVTIVNRKREFARAKAANESLILAAIKDRKLDVAYNAAPVAFEDGAVVLRTPEGDERLPADRVIARLGAEAPKAFVKACGAVFEEGSDFPRVSDVYESDRPGLFVIGALAGYPLIKHCMNQGYEVADYIATGQMPEGPDVALLRDKFAKTPGFESVQQSLERIRADVPLFGGLTILQLREFLLDATVHAPKPGDHLIRRNTAGDSLFIVAQGAVELIVSPSVRPRLETGAFFGEMGLIMGRRRSADVLAAGGAETVCLEIPRTAALKLLASSPVAKRVMDQTAILRQLQTFISPDLTAEALAPVLATAEPLAFAPGDALITEGVEDDDLFVIQKGSCTVTRNANGQDDVLGYLPAGAFVGEMALLYRQPRSATVRASVPVEAVRIRAQDFRALMETDAGLRGLVEAKARERAVATAASDGGDVIARKVAFLTKNGIGEATNAIIIDEGLCIHCDYCEKACAETHDGISRLDRAAGPTFAEIHIPLSCRHCETPHCMADCPPNALYRSPSGAVMVNFETCIGCGNCVRNCPYDAIRMSAKPPPRANLLVQLLFGAKFGIGERDTPKKSPSNPELARKCDLCETVQGGPACVSACPTGAVIRVGPEPLFDMIRRRG